MRRDVKLVHITLPCMLCNQKSSLLLEKAKFDRWKAGEHPQLVWPEKTDEERELIISGTHPDCWDELFEEEYEE